MSFLPVTIGPAEDPFNIIGFIKQNGSGFEAFDIDKSLLGGFTVDTDACDAIWSDCLGVQSRFATCGSAPPEPSEEPPVPDRSQLETFVQVLFRHATVGNWVSLRAFVEDRADLPPVRIAPVKLNGNFDGLIDRAFSNAELAARNPEKVGVLPADCDVHQQQACARAGSGRGPGAVDRVRQEGSGSTGEAGSVAGTGDGGGGERRRVDQSRDRRSRAETACPSPAEGADARQGRAPHAEGGPQAGRHAGRGRHVERPGRASDPLAGVLASQEGAEALPHRRLQSRCRDRSRLGVDEVARGGRGRGFDARRRAAAAAKGNGGKAKVGQSKVADAFAHLKPDNSLGEGIEDYPPVPFEPIKDGCGWLRHVHETGGADQSELLWRDSLRVSMFLENGESLIHEFSNKYDGYDFKATEAKFDRARQDKEDKDLGCPRCKTICDHGSEHCKIVPAPR